MADGTELHMTANYLHSVKDGKIEWLDRSYNYDYHILYFIFEDDGDARRLVKIGSGAPPKVSTQDTVYFIKLMLQRSIINDVIAAIDAWPVTWKNVCASTIVLLKFNSGITRIAYSVRTLVFLVSEVWGVNKISEDKEVIRLALTDTVRISM